MKRLHPGLGPAPHFEGAAFRRAWWDPDPDAVARFAAEVGCTVQNAHKAARARGWPLRRELRRDAKLARRKNGR